MYIQETVTAVNMPITTGRSVLRANFASGFGGFLLPVFKGKGGRRDGTGEAAVARKENHLVTLQNVTSGPSHLHLLFRREEWVLGTELGTLAAQRTRRHHP